MGGAHTVNCLRTKRLGDYCTSALGILCSNAAWYPHDLKALAFQPRVALEVGLDAAGMLVHISVHLDDQSALQANEINHKGPDRVLAAKPQSPLLPAAQNLP